MNNKMKNSAHMRQSGLVFNEKEKDTKIVQLAERVAAKEMAGQKEYVELLLRYSKSLKW